MDLSQKFTQTVDAPVIRSVTAIINEVADHFVYPRAYIARKLDAKFCQAWVNAVATDIKEVDGKDLNELDYAYKYSETTQDLVLQKFGASCLFNTDGGSAYQCSSAHRIFKLIGYGPLSSVALRRFKGMMDGFESPGNAKLFYKLATDNLYRLAYAILVALKNHEWIVLRQITDGEPYAQFSLVKLAKVGLVTCDGKLTAMGQIVHDLLNVVHGTRVGFPRYADGSEVRYDESTAPGNVRQAVFYVRGLIKEWENSEALSQKQWQACTKRYQLTANQLLLVMAAVA